MEVSSYSTIDICGKISKKNVFGTLSARVVKKSLTSCCKLKLGCKSQLDTYVFLHDNCEAFNSSMIRYAEILYMSCKFISAMTVSCK